MNRFEFSMKFGIEKEIRPLTELETKELVSKIGNELADFLEVKEISMYHMNITAAPKSFEPHNVSVLNTSEKKESKFSKPKLREVEFTVTTSSFEIEKLSLEKNKTYRGFFHGFFHEGSTEDGIDMFAMIELEDGRLLRYYATYSMKFINEGGN